MISIIFKAKTSFDSSPNNLEQINSDYNYANSLYAFGNLSKINVFIGENNSGKSRFLRHLFVSGYHSIENEEFIKFFNELKNGVYQHYDIIPKSNIEKFNKIYERLGSEKSSYTNVGNTFFKTIKKYSRTVDSASKFYFPTLRGSKDYKTIINNKLRSFLSSTNSIQNKDSINHYISLLNLETQGLESFDIYNDIITHEYFKDNKSLHNNIFTGGKLYQEIKSMLLGEESQRKIIEDFQKFLQEHFFTEYDRVQLIPNEKQKVLYVKIGRDERAIYDLGDGTQQLIVILYSLFKYKDKKDCLFFIEEPEMYLHPGILRKFIEVINLDIFENHQYFITTHSNIILDVSAETDVNMSIFKFKKVKEQEKNNGASFIIEQCNNGDVSLLNDLGIRNSSVFLSNCSIWVEGITDRLYLKHYLSLYANEFNKKIYREGIDYTFIEYGGGNVTHFNFDESDSDNAINTKYINNKIFLIADNDGSLTGSAKAIRKEHFRDVLKENFYELDGLEIENLISNEVLKNLLIKQNTSNVEIINKKFKEEKKYTKVKLGTYIDKLFKNTDVKKYADKSGTVKDKVNFCKSVIGLTTDYNLLSDESKILAEKIYQFIEKNNTI